MFILKLYIQEIKYISGAKIIMAGAMYMFTLEVKPKYTHE